MARSRLCCASPMHVALTNQDILREIFGHFDTCGFHHAEVVRKNRQALARSARVSTAFSDVALGLLWRKLSSILPLLRLFATFRLVRAPSHFHPDDEVFIGDMASEVHTLCGEISQPEWERFQYYAHLVRGVKCVLTGRIMPSVFFYLSRRNQCKPLLPLLQVLHWTQNSLMDTSILSLISPTLRRLHIEYASNWAPSPDGSFSLADHELGMLLCNLCAEIPSLGDLQISGIQQPKLLLPISSYKNLHSLDMHGSAKHMDRDLIQALAGLERLRELSMDIVLASTESILPFNGFHQLEVLMIDGATAHVLRFLAALSLPRLSTLDVRDMWASGPFDDCAALISTCARFFGTLRTFRLRTPYAFGPDDAMPEQTLMTHLAPLLDAHALQTVDIDLSDRPLALSDADFGAMAAAWPELSSLSLAFRGREVSEVPTLNALVALARGCPRLAQLKLPYLKLTVAPPFEACVLLTHGLRTLRVEGGGGHVEDAPKCARLLDLLFPHLDAAGALLRVRGGSTADAWPTMLRMWKMVQEERQMQMRAVGVIKARSPTGY